MRLQMLAVAVLLVAVNADADWFGNCGETAQRRVAAPTSGVSHITVIGKAGSLRVTGRAGVREVVATGTACADDKDTLNQVQLRAQQNGSDLRIEAVIPENGSWFGSNKNARLDFEVIVPDMTAIEITDGSGSATIENVGPAKIVDGSGSLTIEGVHGDLSVDDGSGGVEIDDVQGSVTVEDGSGSLTIRRVQRNVVVSDGSGGIDVSDVRGDFTVRDDGSGGVDYDRIAGRVTIPRRR